MRTEISINPSGKYSVSQAAEALGISRKTVTRWREAGLIRGELGKSGRYKFKGSVLIRAYNTR